MQCNAHQRTACSSIIECITNHGRREDIDYCQKRTGGARVNDVQFDCCPIENSKPTHHDDSAAPASGDGTEGTNHHEFHSDVDTSAPTANASANDQHSTVNGSSDNYTKRWCHIVIGRFEFLESNVHRIAKGGAQSTTVLDEHINQSNRSIVTRSNDSCLRTNGTSTHRSGWHQFTAVAAVPQSGSNSFQ